MAVALDVLRAALQERYAVEREVGRGAMAVVFLARAVEDARLVAIKVLHPAYATVVGAARFQREIALLVALQHPNILPVLDAGQSGPFSYYVMPYAEGDSLQARLARDLRLSLAETVAILREVAAAVDYAHARNVVHRDLKPENIVFEHGRAMVCDFGVARAIEVAGGDLISSSGLIIGTPTYMSPEQASGSSHVDARSDIYALGCLVYEMLVGEPPFTGPTVQAVLARHLAEQPPSLRVLRKDVPADVEDAVLAALAKRPEERPGSGAAFVQLLADAA